MTVPEQEQKKLEETSTQGLQSLIIKQFSKPKLSPEQLYVYRRRYIPPSFKNPLGNAVTETNKFENCPTVLMSILTTRNLLKLDAFATLCYGAKFLIFPEWFLENSLLLRDNATRVLRLWGLGMQPGVAASQWLVASMADEDTVHAVGILHCLWSALGAASFYLFMPAGSTLNYINVGLYSAMSALFAYTTMFAPRPMKKI